MTLNDLILKIKVFEGFRKNVYIDAGGTPTIGYGRTNIKSMDETTTKEKEDRWLTEKVSAVYENVRQKMLAWGYYSLSTNQLLALTDFTYNLGIGNLNKLTANGQRDISAIAEKILLYNKCNGEELNGLTKRRKWEYDLFFSNSEQPKKENVLRETWNINYKYNSHDVQELCNKIIKDNNLPYEPLVIDGILGEKSTDLIFTLLYKGYGYL